MATIHDSSGISFEVPSPVHTEAESAGFDSAVTVWTANGYQITIDRGPFADPLTQYRSRPGHAAADESVNGGNVRVVEFTDADGTKVVGAHFPRRPDETGADGISAAMTVIVRLDPGTPEDVALKIIGSIRFPTSIRKKGE
ncbi:hypothetical protein ACWCPF_34740 [Streptomyces sp. NPDC001858]